MVFAYYHDCDPIGSRQVEKKDQIFPLFVMQVMGDIPGVPGLFVAGVFSGALSTVSSGLNSLAAVCLKDFLGSGCKINLSEDRAALVTKILAVLFGVLGYGIVFLVKYLPGVLEVRNTGNICTAKYYWFYSGCSGNIRHSWRSSAWSIHPRDVLPIRQ